MTTDNFTTASQDLLNKSATLAIKLNNSKLYPIHMLAAALDNEFCLSFFNIADIPTHELKILIKRELSVLAQESVSEPKLSPATEHFLQTCKKEADKLGDTYISL